MFFVCLLWLTHLIPKLSLISSHRFFLDFFYLKFLLSISVASLHFFFNLLFSLLQPSHRFSRRKQLLQLNVIEFSHLFHISLLFSCVISSTFEEETSWNLSFPPWFSLTWSCFLTYSTSLLTYFYSQIICIFFFTSTSINASTLSTSIKSLKAINSLSSINK